MKLLEKIEKINSDINSLNKTIDGLINEQTTGNPVIDGALEVTGNIDSGADIIAAGNVDGVDITGSGDVADATSTLVVIRTTYNSHTHTHGVGPGVTGPPVPTM